MPGSKDDSSDETRGSFRLANPPPAFPSMRIGLLGGSFNPAHLGHRRISIAALKLLSLHRVWWLATPGNPLKDRTELAALDDRLARARSTAAHPRIEVTDFEAALASPFTVDTLQFLQRRYTGVRFVWIMGGDNLAQFHYWRSWQTIFELMPILVADRPAARHKALAAPAARRFEAARLPERLAPGLAAAPPPAWTYLSLPLCALSSTDIRARKPG